MLPIILSVLGLGGVAGVAAILWPSLIPMAFGFLKAIPGKAWLYIAIATAVVGAVVWHLDTAHKALKAQYAAGYSQRETDDAAALKKAITAAQAWKQKFDQTNVKLSQALKEKHDEKVVAVNATVADLVRSGPGKAACGRLDYPSPVAVPSRSQPSAGTGNGAVGEVPDRGGAALIALPFNDALRFAGQCDINRDEAARAREQYEALAKSWPTH